MNILRRIVQAVVLPKEITSFEEGYLRRTNRIALVFFALHIPVMVLLAACNGTNPLLALALTSAVVAGPALAVFTFRNPRAISMIHGVAAMFVGGLLVHFGQGPVQIEMHFYFFALLAMLAVFGNPMVILVAAVTVALHHLVLWFALPKSVFNYAAPVWVVAVHAGFVVLESIAGCFIARSFFDNVIGLEKIVRARTSELHGRNRDMRTLLDNVEQGFVTIDREGLPSAERSAALDRWIGEPRAGESLFELLRRSNSDFGELSAVSFTQVTDGVMPAEVMLEQMPHALVIKDSQFHVAYQPITDGDSEAPSHFLVVVSDVTERFNKERAERERAETMALCERLVSDRNAVNDFFDETGELIDAVTAQETTTQATHRMLHTIKGNSAIFGLASLSETCHDLESRIADGALVPEDLVGLREQWTNIRQKAERWLGARGRVIELDVGQQDLLEQAIRSKAPWPTLLAMVNALKLESTDRRLEHFGEQALRIAGRLDKNLDIKLDSGCLRVDPKRWAPFWSAFVHAVRNAVDHGIESPDERAATGKKPHGSIELATRLREDDFVISITDDGRGVDWARVKTRALKLGLPTDGENALRDALFCDGVSTADRITDLSGRGLGMGALREATQSLGGTVEVTTSPGAGTKLSMVFPKRAMSAEVTSMSVRPASHEICQSEQVQ